jgi:hypothetical protein
MHELKLRADITVTRWGIKTGTDGPAKSRITSTLFGVTVEAGIVANNAAPDALTVDLNAGVAGASLGAGVVMLYVGPTWPSIFIGVTAPGAVDMSENGPSPALMQVAAPDATRVRAKPAASRSLNGQLLVEALNGQ